VKIKLQLKRTPTSEPEYYYTNLFVITEWERVTRRAPRDVQERWLNSDWACMMHIVLKLKGEQVHEDWREWLKQNCEYEISPAADLTDPNPTDAAPTAAN